MAAPVTQFRPPGPGYRLLRFSDNTYAWMPPEATADDWKDAVALGENQRDQKYMAQAAQQNSPVNTADKVYSATRAYPSGAHGQLTAWMDHHLGGNAINNSNVWKTVEPYVAPVSGAISRIGTAAIETNPYVRAVDLGVTGYNAVKHLATKVVPQLANVPDSQSILGLTRSALGTPELDPNASAAQRVLENAASVSLNPSSWNKTALLDTLGRSGSSYVGGEAGGALGGETGQIAGSLYGASPGTGSNLLRRVMAPAFRGRNTQPVSTAADNQGIQPTAGAVSNPIGRQLDKVIGATPFIGSAVRSAQERFNDAIRQRQQEVAEDVFGGPLPGGVSNEDIGASLIAGARQGAANLTQQARDEQQQLITGKPANPLTGQPAQPGIGANTPVNARSVYRGPAGYSAARLQMDPGVYPAYAARLDNIRQAAIEAQHPFFQNFWGALNAGEVPYQRFQELRSNLGADLPGYSGMTSGQQDQLYEAMTDAMRDAAFQRGGQDLVDRFDNANANYKSLIGKGGQRDQLQMIGGQPQTGGWDQFMGPNGQTQPATGVDFTGGKGEGQAATWFNSNLRSPEKLAPFADPTIVPNDFWREAVGQWLATRGQTDEGTFRPDLMARQWGGDDTAANKGVGGDVKTQLFTGPGGGTTANSADMDDLATLGRNAVVPINRSGLTDTANSVFAWKFMLDQLKHVGGIGAMLGGGKMLANTWANPEWANTIRGQPTPLVDSLYNGLPVATQTIMQAQTNPTPAYDPLGWGVTAGQNPP